MSDIELLKCNICGGELTPLNENTYRCACCGNLFAKKQESLESSLKKALGEEKYARVSAARQNLWAAMHEEYVNSSSCLEYARDLKSLVPSDYYANFAEVANGKNDADLSKFLNSSSAEDMETYADVVLDFMLKSLTAGTLTAVCAYIDRTFSDKSTRTYNDTLNLYEREAEKVNAGIYEVTQPRDVFLAYASADMPKVIELCDYLEDQEVSCFFAMRNLRHGRGAADNYDKTLKTAMDNCRIILYVSSTNSRKIGCDAYRIEIPYIRWKDMESAPSEYRNGSYEKLPSRYKKNRIEYLLDDYKGAPADKAVKEFFSGYEWCRTLEDVADRVITYLTSEPEIDDGTRPVETVSSIDEESLQKIVSEAIAKANFGSNSRGIGEDDIQKIISAVSAQSSQSGIEKTSKTLPSYDIKKRNILNQVSQFISAGDFAFAKKRIDSLEKDELNRLGVCSAAVYYYRLLVEYEASDDDELVNKLVETSENLDDDDNFYLADFCEDSPEKTKILEIKKRVADIVAENERKIIEQKEREKREAENKQREEELRIKSMWIAGLNWQLGNEGYTVTGANKIVNSDLFIPSKYKDKPVVSIGDHAFRNCALLKSIDIPGSVLLIGSWAFEGCVSINTVTIGHGTKTINTWAFKGCASLRSITIPSSVTSINSYAFNECASLRDIYYSGSQTDWERIYIGDRNYSLEFATVHYNYKSES